jgi:[ribosomal protein S5]-alanine N-acetyltransferase
MSRAPLIITQRLRLDDLEADDAARVFRYASDPDVARFTAWPPHRTLAESEEWLARAMSNFSSDPARFRCCWAIRLQEGIGSLLGAVEFGQHPPDCGRIDYVLARPYWGHGIGTEAVQAVIDLAFKSLPQLDVIRSGGLAENDRSIAVMKKCGMVFEGTTEAPIQKLGGELRDVAHYRITRREYESQHTPRTPEHPV